MINNSNFNIATDDVQSSWNLFEDKLCTIVNILAPFVPFMNNSTIESNVPPPIVKNKLNLRKKIVEKDKFEGKA